MMMKIKYILVLLLKLVILVHVNANFQEDIHSLEHFANNIHVKFQKATDINTGMGFGMALDNSNTPIAEMDPAFWRNSAYAELKQRLVAENLNLNKAKNIIMFLGDGMSLSTVTGARILKGQRQGKTGEEELLSFEKFPYTGLSKTYCTNAQVADSACSATAYLCGVKTNTLTIGVSAAVNLNNCSAGSNPANHVSSIAAWAQAAGKSTGIITTTTLTHASPSGAYAHIPNRQWECDADVVAFGNPGTDPKRCTMDIAQQLITQAPGRNFDVMLGGGMGKFLPNTLKDLHGNLGERQDGQNLLSRWQGMHPGGLVVKNREQMLRLNITQVKNVMGLFQSKLMTYHLKADPKQQPTLAEMTETALKLLSKNDKNGYFVFIEGGLIDYGNHENKAAVSLDETLEMDKAIQVALNMTNSKDTLIVVTADHAHPLSISGYPGRGNNILNLNNMGVDSAGVKYSTLNYAVGPNQYLNAKGKRQDLTGKMGASDFIFPSYINNGMGVHGGDDVGVYAFGPHAHLFSGVMQQNSIPHMMAYAACIGNGPKLCDNRPKL